jgi:glycosyltransferase involved in cell wall biosynthesis
VTENQKADLKSALTVFDGWPLAYAPFSPAGLHLLTLLEAPPDGTRRLVLLPGPSKLVPPKSCEVMLYPTGSTPGGRLAWEQVRLPQQARRHGANKLVLTRPTPPVAGQVPCVYWPTGEEDLPNRQRSLAERLRLALAAGGQSELQQMMWPADLPLPQSNTPFKIQPPKSHPLFYENNPLEVSTEPLVPTYILYAGPYDAHNLRLLLAGWSWAAPSLGDETQLVLLHLPQEQQRVLDENDLTASVRRVQPGTLAGLAALYRQAAAVVHLGPTVPWGDAVTASLASGQALVARDEPLTAARCGPAAFLVPPDNPRALGAAVLTLIVEEQLNGQLREAARKQVSDWGL